MSNVAKNVEKNINNYLRCKYQRKNNNPIPWVKNNILLFSTSMNIKLYIYQSNFVISLKGNTFILTYVLSK